MISCEAKKQTKNNKKYVKSTKKLKLRKKSNIWVQDSLAIRTLIHYTFCNCYIVENKKQNQCRYEIIRSSHKFCTVIGKRQATNNEGCLYWQVNFEILAKLEIWWLETELFPYFDILSLWPKNGFLINTDIWYLYKYFKHLNLKSKTKPRKLQFWSKETFIY